MSIRYHGKNCGPGWSNDKYQSSVCNDGTPADDELDKVCLDHDCDYVYAKGDPYLLNRADQRFIDKVEKLSLEDKFSGVNEKLKAKLAAELIALQKNGRMNPQKKQKRKPNPGEIVIVSGGNKGRTVQIVQQPAVKRVAQFAALPAPPKTGKSQHPRVMEIVKHNASPTHAVSNPRPNLQLAKKVKKSKGIYAAQEGRVPSVGVKSQKYSANAVTVIGTEYFGPVETSAVAPSRGTLLSSTYVSPQDLTATRLKQFAPLYERYVFKALVFHYVPAVGTSTAGNIIGYVDADASDPVGPPGVDTIRDAMSTKGAMMFPVYQRADIWLRNPRPPPLFTSQGSDTSDAEDRLTRQGQFLLFANGTLAPSTNFGELYFTYKIKFWIPHTQIISTAHNAAAFYAGGTVNVTYPLGADSSGESVGDFVIPHTTADSVAKITLPAVGRWLLVWNFYTDVGSTVSPSMTMSAGMGTTIKNFGTGLGQQYATVTFIANVTDVNGGTINFSASSTGGIMGSILYVSMVPAGITDPEFPVKRKPKIEDRMKELEEALNKLKATGSTLERKKKRKVKSISTTPVSRVGTIFSKSAVGAEPDSSSEEDGDDNN